MTSDAGNVEGHLHAPSSMRGQRRSRQLIAPLRAAMCHGESGVVGTLACAATAAGIVSSARRLFRSAISAAPDLTLRFVEC